MEAARYTITTAPKLASNYEWDCALCGHETLKRPVFLDNGAGVIAAGAACAAQAIYGDRAKADKVRKAAEAAAYRAMADEAARIERRGRYSAALADFAADDWTPELRSAQAAYRGTVRGPWAGEHRMTFPAFIAAVAESGTLPD